MCLKTALTMKIVSAVFSIKTYCFPLHGIRFSQTKKLSSVPNEQTFYPDIETEVFHEAKFPKTQILQTCIK
jgi:hypothetical protein